MVGAGFGVLYLGVAATECHAACSLLRLPRATWPDVAERVQHLGQLVAERLNRRTQRRR